MRTIGKYSLLSSVLLFSSVTLAAQPIDLKNQPTAVLKSFVGSPQHRGLNTVEMKEISRSTDSNKVQHLRMQEYYRGYPIWNAHAVVHVKEEQGARRSFSTIINDTPKIKSMNGTVYQELGEDLNKAPDSVFTEQNAENAEQFAVEAYKAGLDQQDEISVKNTKSQVTIFIDKNHVAHWVYHIQFEVPADSQRNTPAKPHYIIDAQSLEIYKAWNAVKTLAQSEEFVQGGGLGGNPTTGKIYYDGSSPNFPSFTVRRDASQQQCYLENNEVVVKHAITEEVMHYACTKKNTRHNNLYWSEDFDAINQGYSPANDAMFIAKTIQSLYRDWCQVPALINPDGTKMQLRMMVHYPKMDNAFWDGEKMSFGDGNLLYPLTSLGIGAHEVSHGFTQQHSNLNYDGQSGGMNESFSDMAAAAAEFYIFKSNSWKIGQDVFKILDEALRYLDIPSKDCYGKIPGTNCSIDRADQYYEGLDVHYSSGVYNRVFYLLSTTLNWDPSKTFRLMAHANASYWLPETQYEDGAACVLKAAEDLGYEIDDVKEAFRQVGINADVQCVSQSI